MNDSFGGDAFNATAGAAGAQSEQKSEGLAPAVIKQIHESAETNFQMWGMNFGMISCVVIVRGIETSSTKITYLLEDHTGQIEAHYWIEEGEVIISHDIMLHNYVHVYGTVRQHGGKKALMIFKIVPTTNINEITTHLLEVLTARYKAEEYSKKTGREYSDFSMGATGAGFSIQQPAGGTLGLEGKQLVVYQAIKSYVGEEGISMNELQRKFSHISGQELQTITDFLTQEGHIYTSIDAEHFLSTDM